MSLNGTEFLNHSENSCNASRVKIFFCSVVKTSFHSLKKLPVFIHDFERVNEFTCEIACHVKYWSVTEIVTLKILLQQVMNVLLKEFGISGQISCSLRKIHLCVFIPNCTRNHLITYTHFTDFRFFSRFTRTNSSNLFLYQRTLTKGVYLLSRVECDQVNGH